MNFLDEDIHIHNSKEYKCSTADMNSSNFGRAESCQEKIMSTKREKSVHHFNLSLHFVCICKEVFLLARKLRIEVKHVISSTILKTYFSNDDINISVLLVNYSRNFSVGFALI